MALGENVLLFQNKHLKKLLVEKTNQLETLNHKIGKVEQIKSKQEKSIIAFQQLLRSVSFSRTNQNKNQKQKQSKQRNCKYRMIKSNQMIVLF